MINCEEISSILKEKRYETGNFLIKFPLPLNLYRGEVVTEDEFNDLNLLIKELITIRNIEGNNDHFDKVNRLLERTKLPVHTIYKESICTILREYNETKYYVKTNVSFFSLKRLENKTN